MGTYRDLTRETRVQAAKTAAEESIIHGVGPTLDHVVNEKVGSTVAKLIFSIGSMKYTIPLRPGQEIIGRHQGGSTIVIKDERVSRIHAILNIHTDGHLVVRDAGSINGTYINDRMIVDPTGVKIGDVVRVGQTEMTIISAD